MFGKLAKESQLAILTAIFQQSHIEPDEEGNWPSPYADLWAAGVLFCNVDPTGTYATISMPLPALLPCLSLRVPLPEYLTMFDPANAFEVLVTLWAASEYSGIERFIGEVANFKALQEQKESAFAVFTDPTQAKIDWKCNPGNVNLKAKGRKLVLIQTKRADFSHQAEQMQNDDGSCRLGLMLAEVPQASPI